MNVQIDLPEIDGYEYTGEFRTPREGEKYLQGNMQFTATACRDHSNPEEKRFILKAKPKKYRPFKDYEEMKPHRERMVHVESCRDGKPLWYEWGKTGRNSLCEHYVFEDTGEPVGVCE